MRCAPRRVNTGARARAIDCAARLGYAKQMATSARIRRPNRRADRLQPRALGAVALVALLSGLLFARGLSHPAPQRRAQRADAVERTAIAERTPLTVGVAAEPPAPAPPAPAPKPSFTQGV